MKKALWTFLFKLAGWKISGSYPKGLRKAVIIAGPHTSSWDFFLGVGTRAIGEFPSYFMIKDSWIKVPIIGSLLKAIGGVAVDRSGNKKMSLSEATIKAYNEHDEFAICIAPEGTRKYQPKLKTGFWHIAKGANVPLVPVSFDYATKTVYWNDPIYVSDDKEKDIEKVKALFRQYKGKHPEKGIQ